MIYGDITPRQAAHSVKRMLKRAIPDLVFEKFGQTYVLPKNETKTARFRRYNALAPATTPLTEGVAPAGKTLTVTDVDIALSQYGDFVEISDVILDTHEDPVLMQSSEILGEQQAETIETLRYETLRAGTNVFYANGVSRAAVNTVMNATLQKRITKALKRQNAKKITNVVRSTVNFGTEAVAASYIAVIHPDLEADIRAMPGFVPAENYGTITPYETEIGKCVDVRYLTTTIAKPFADAGGAAGGTLESTGGTNCDVYPILFFGANAYGIVPLKGKTSTQPMVRNPKPVKGDELAQTGSVGWKAWNGSGILNDMWMVRAEVACSL
jgi:N4-gp56 family major capsid protein